jgi:ubiquinone/menaquinone biosynthesis C-methylase UbiE
MNKVDLDWDDSEVLPEIIRPDVEFLFQRMTQATLQELNASQGDIILDVGCGRALDAVNMAEKGATVIAIEPSLVMISHALESINRSGRNISLLRGVGEFIPVMHGTVDKVVCKGALDHFINPDNAIKQMVAVLKPHGTIVVSIANFESLGFKMGKLIYGIRRLLRIKNPYKRLPW